MNARDGQILIIMGDEKVASVSSKPKKNKKTKKIIKKIKQKQKLLV